MEILHFIIVVMCVTKKSNRRKYKILNTPNRFIICILIRSVLIGNINIGLIMIENKHTKHASKYGLGSRRCSKISKVIILVIIFI